MWLVKIVLWSNFTFWLAKCKVQPSWSSSAKDRYDAYSCRASLRWATSQIFLMNKTLCTGTVFMLSVDSLCFSLHQIACEWQTPKFFISIYQKYILVLLVSEEAWAPCRFLNWGCVWYLCAYISQTWCIIHKEDEIW